MAVALGLFVASSLPAAHGCSSFVVNCESDGAVVTVRTLDFSSDLVAATVSSAAGVGEGHGHQTGLPLRSRMGAGQGRLAVQRIPHWLSFAMPLPATPAEPAPPTCCP